MYIRNRLSSDQWSLRHVLRFLLRLAPHHTRRACLCRSVMNGRLIDRRAFRPAARKLLLMVLLDTHTPAPQCNRRNGAVVIWMRLARRTKSLSSLGVVLCVLLCLERSFTCPVSACFLTSLLIQCDWCPSWHQYFYRTSLLHASQLPAIGHFQAFFALAYQNSDPIQHFIDLRKPRVCIYHTVFFEFIPCRFSALARSGRDTRTAWNIVWILRCPSSI